VKRSFVIVAVLGAAAHAWGYSYLTNSLGLPLKWYAASIGIQIKADNSTVLSDGNTPATSIQAAMKDATRGWNHVLGLVQFTPQIAAVGPGADHDNINQIFFSSAPYSYGWEANTLAVTTSWYSSDQRKEADIIFNTAFAWDSYRGPLRTNGTYDIQRIALHELGHVLGLDHPDEHGQTVSAIMNSVSGDTDSLQADDIAGAQNLYGAPGVRPGNDNFANATVITLTNNAAQVTGTNIAATRETGEPSHGDDADGHSVWWQWTAPGNGKASLNTSGSNFQPALAAYSGSSLSTLTQLASDSDDSDGTSHFRKVSFAATAGTTYYIAVAGIEGDFGKITLNLSLSNPPAITVQPASQTITEGSSVGFSVTASGAPPLSYQWRKNGTAIGGATATNFSLNPAGLGDAGNYDVVVTNGGGSTTSTTAVLSVSPLGPTITGLSPTNEELETGNSLDLSVTASGTGAVTYQWIHNGAAISGATSSRFTVGKVTSTDAGDYCVAVTDSKGTRTSATITVVVAKLNAVTFPDFNGDGKADVVWSNSATGDRAIWFLNGTAVSSFGYLAGIPTDWHIVGAADFDGDGKTDLLWENVTTGDRSFWLMNGTAISSFSYLALVDPAWHIAAVGDFNGDGKADIVWENLSTGDRAIWFLSGTGIASFAYLAGVSADWRIVGAADFDGDGKTDLLWENTTTRDRSFWLMNGTAISSFVYLANVDPAWHVAAVADYDGDGQTDLLWENTTTGDRAIWLMSGTNHTGSPYLAYVDPVWAIAP
jgi:hypothetical protein